MSETLTLAGPTADRVASPLEAADYRRVDTALSEAFEEVDEIESRLRAAADACRQDKRLEPATTAADIGELWSFIEGVAAQAADIGEHVAKMREHLTEINLHRLDVEACDRSGATKGGDNG